MSKIIGVILVNYQDYAAKYLADCFLSLEKQTYPQDRIKIYIVDNASTVDSQAYLKTNYPKTTILARSDGNYAAANNLGARQAITDGCEYLLMLNMDTLVDPDCLKELATALENKEGIAIVQAKIYLAGAQGEKISERRLNSLGNIVHFLGFGFTRGYGQSEEKFSAFLNSVPYPEIPGYASGCALMIKREAFEKIKGYGEEYYMYHDDLELSLKARLAGYLIVLAPRAVVYHKYEFKRSIKMLYYMERNRRLFLLSFYPWPLLIFLAPALLLMEFGLLAYALKNGWYLELAKAKLYFFKARTWRLICARRQELKAQHCVPFSKIAVDFAGAIDFQEISNPLLKYIANPILGLYWRGVKLFI